VSIIQKLERLQGLLKQKGRGEPQEAVVDEKPGQVSLTRDPEQTPERLKGMSWGEILLLDLDGALDEREQEWLSMKQLPGRLPNLKALARRAERLSGAK
jgi:hypothetical protein